MINKSLVLFFVCFLLCLSCATTQKSSLKMISYKKNYVLTYKSGTFSLARESGFDSSSRNYVTKYKIQDTNNQKILEKVITFSEVKNLSKKVKVLSPVKSKYQVWFDGKVHQTTMTVNEKEGLLLVKMRSPEDQWNGEKRVPMVKGNGVRCFYSQVVECAYRIGFLQKAIKLKSGKMAFSLIWEGYPYIQEQYLNIKSEPVTQASLSYDGKNQVGEHRFSLNFGGNSVFYFVDKKFRLDRIFWPSQGLSVVSGK